MKQTILCGGHLPKKTTLLSAALLCAVVGCSAYFASRLQLEEDVSKIIPASSELQTLNSIYKHSNLLERLTLTVSLTDSSSQPDVGELERYTNALVGQLRDTTDGSPFKEIAYRVSESRMGEIYSVFYENLPLFLSRQDYSVIDSAITSSSVGQAVERNYKTLVSPVGIMAKKFLLLDPISLTPLALKKLEALRTNGPYVIHDGYVLTQDKRNLLVFISSRYPPTDTDRNALLLSRIDNAIRIVGERFQGRVQAEYFGGLAVSVGNAERVKLDVKVTIALSALLLIGFIAVFVNIRWAAVLTFLPALFGALLSLAVLYLVKGRISIIAVGVGSILLGIGVDYALYILAQIRPGATARMVAKELSFPVLVCSATTAAVFLCLLFVKTDALKELGLFMGVGVLGAAVFSVTWFPSLIGMNERGDVLHPDPRRVRL